MSTTQNKMFYKKNRLSNFHADSASYTVLSVLDINILERSDSGEKSALLVTDQQGSTLMMQSQSRIHLAYNPFGFAPTAPALCQYAGELCLPIIEGYLLGNGHRWFNPSLMRFSSPDRLSPFAKGGINAYSYCGNDPINNTDASGQFLIAVIKKMMGTSRKQLYDKLTVMEKNRNLEQPINTYNSFNSIQHKSLKKLAKRDLDESSGRVKVLETTKKQADWEMENNRRLYTEKDIYDFNAKYNERADFDYSLNDHDLETNRLIKEMAVVKRFGFKRYYLQPTARNKSIRVNGSNP